ncbi:MULTISPECIES: hypothetical protein [unclassified Acinetobacter]|uniref:hypothetical protein n=1 Tax=unclassified Acinetobacter TaxID=196816 RepID=UPI0015D37E0B|nr:MULTISPECIES: hypothetical protein [unclassified Acinetobacter]
MAQKKQAALYLQQLKQQYPAAFKHNYLFYSQLKTQGILDELKELIPWVLAAMIFISLSMSIGHAVQLYFPEMSEFRAHGIAVLSIMLFFMLVVPLVIKQIKHSSMSLYQSLKNTPFRLAIVILLQLLNIAFLQSTFVQSVLFFFAMSFGFVRFYKENLFKGGSNTQEYYFLQETRRIAYWSYKQMLKAKLRLSLSNPNQANHKQLSERFTQFQNLHIQMLHQENQLCKKLKHQNVEHYLDELMK